MPIANCPATSQPGMLLTGRCKALLFHKKNKKVFNREGKWNLKLQICSENGPDKKKGSVRTTLSPQKTKSEKNPCGAV